MIESIAHLETKEERKKRLNRERQQRYRKKEFPERRQLRLAAAAQAARERRAEESQQQRELRQIKDALATQARRDRETEYQRELRLAAVAQATRKRRAKETQQQRELRKLKDALATNARRGRETVYQRVLRLAAVGYSPTIFYEPSKEDDQHDLEVKNNTEDTKKLEDRNSMKIEFSPTRLSEERMPSQQTMNCGRDSPQFEDTDNGLRHNSYPTKTCNNYYPNTLNQKDQILKEYEELLEKCETEERIQIIREYESFQVLGEKFHVDPEYMQTTVSQKEQILKSCKNYYRVKTTNSETWNETKSAAITLSDSYESNTDKNIFKAADGPTSSDPSNLTAVKIEILPIQLMEYNGPQAIRTEENASMEKSLLTSNDNNLEESNSSNLEVFADETMETIYLSSSGDNEAADQCTTHKKDEMNSDTGKLLSIRREPEAFEKNDGIDISYEGFKIKTEPQMLEEEHIEWNAVKTHPQAIKVESIEIKTEPHHMLESNQVEDNPGNGIAIKREIIDRENYASEKRSDKEREFLLNQNSIDSCPPCSDIIVPAESLGNFKSILLLDCSETVKKENDIHCDQQLSPTNLPKAKEACGHDFFPDDIDTLDDAMKLLEMLAIYAATTENCRAMIVLSQLEEALKE